MPAESALTDLGRELLADLPGNLQSTPEYRALCHVWAKESERLEGYGARIRDNAITTRVDEWGLPWWEAYYSLSGAGTVDERKAAVQAAASAEVGGDPSGLRWKQDLIDRLGLGWSYEEDGPGTIRITVPWVPGSDAFNRAEVVARRFTPAAWVVIVQSEGGFILDQSQMDQEPFHPS
jgi:hypothetical protein